MQIKMKRVCHKIAVLVFGAAVFGCAAPKYGYHSKIVAKDCKSSVSATEVDRELLRFGFLRSVEEKGPLKIYKKSNFVKQSALSQEAFKDHSGELAVAVCPLEKGAQVVLEEWKSCVDVKDCTKKDQETVAQLLEKMGCKTEFQGKHDKSWRIESRQDWTRESCETIVSSLQF